MNDVVIIGGGPAGTCAAVFLARAGWSVTLIEQHRFPRDKVCGECLSALGVEVLDRIGLAPRLVSAGAIPLHRAIIHGNDGESITTPLPRPMLGISRHVLDAELLAAATNAGALLRQPVRCEAILAPAAPLSASRGGGEKSTGNDCRSSVRIRDLVNNAVETLSPSLVILADGKSALPDSPPAASGDIGIKSHWISVDGPRDAIELFACRGCYGGLAAIEGDRWNAAFSVPAGRVRAHRGDINSLFAELIGENRSLALRLSTATRTGPWLAAALPRFGVRKEWPAGVIPLGNAAAALEPIGGEGMGLALRSAELAVDALLACDGLWAAATERKLRREYEALWRVRRLACRATAMVVSSTKASEIALDFARNNGALVGMVMRGIGK